MLGMALESGTPVIATHKILNRKEDLPSDQRNCVLRVEIQTIATNKAPDNVLPRCVGAWQRGMEGGGDNGGRMTEAGRGSCGMGEARFARGGPEKGAGGGGIHISFCRPPLRRLRFDWSVFTV